MKGFKDKSIQYKLELGFIFFSFLSDHTGS